MRVVAATPVGSEPLPRPPVFFQVGVPLRKTLVIFSDVEELVRFAGGTLPQNQLLGGGQ